MSERFKVTTSKVVVGETSPRVRIPPSPNDSPTTFMVVGLSLYMGEDENLPLPWVARASRGRNGQGVEPCRADPFNASEQDTSTPFSSG